MHSLDRWMGLPHMAPDQWALAWALRNHKNWRWRLQMGEIYIDGSFCRHEGVIARIDEPLPFLLDDPTAGRLLADLARTGDGWSEDLVDMMGRCEDWREAVARALIRRW